MGLNVTMSMVDAAIDFACHNSGDRMALFMAESGIDFFLNNHTCSQYFNNEVFPSYKIAILPIL